MYPNLRAEMARRKVSQTHLADVIGVRIGTMSKKIAGHSSFTLDEANAIKAELNTELTLEELFSKDEV